MDKFEEKLQKIIVEVENLMRELDALDHEQMAMLQRLDMARTKLSTVIRKPRILNIEQPEILEE